VTVDHNGAGPCGLAATVAVARSTYSLLPPAARALAEFKDVPWRSRRLPNAKDRSARDALVLAVWEPRGAIIGRD